MQFKETPEEKSLCWNWASPGLLLFYSSVNLGKMCKCSTCRYTRVCQKRAPDHITDGHEPPCGCWELNSGPLDEQSVLLTAEPSLQPQHWIFLMEKLLNIWVHAWKASSACPTRMSILFWEENYDSPAMNFLVGYQSWNHMHMNNTKQIRQVVCVCV